MNNTIFDAIRARVTAKDAAQVYSLKFGRNGRALCPWHNDHTPDLAFYGEWCFCHACHNGGDAVSLTAQIFSLSMLDAARRLNVDFALNLDMNAPPEEQQHLVNRAEEQRKAREAEQQRWNFLCDVVHEADERLIKMKDGWDNPMFSTVLAARARADCELDMMWEAMCHARRA